MITLINNGFYTVKTDSHDKYHDLIRKLGELLPHGSGLNYDWYIKAYQFKGRIHLRAYNHYDAMDEYGGYCHVYDICAHYVYNPETNKPCHICEGKGYRLLSEFHKYHPTMTESELINWLEKEQNIKIYDNHTILLFTCNYCHGTKQESVPEFELLPNRIVKGKELHCCGYGLDEYLGATLYIWAEMIKAEQENINHD